MNDVPILETEAETILGLVKMDIHYLTVPFTLKIELILVAYYEI